MDITEHLRTRDTALKVNELAELMNCSEGKITKMARTGRIPHFRLGAMLRFDPGKILEWLEKKSI